MFVIVGFSLVGDLDVFTAVESIVVDYGHAVGNSYVCKAFACLQALLFSYDFKSNSALILY